MLKLFILIMSSFLFFNACSIKNPLNKKSKFSYIDCPQTLILAPASKISNDQVTMTLNKGYSVNCYLPQPDSPEVVIEYNYSIETLYKIPNSKTQKIEFIVFITNKKEDIKIYEENFIKVIETNLPVDEMTESYTQISSFVDKLKLDKKTFEDGIKAFIAIN
jgi:hypothetical protein